MTDPYSNRLSQFQKKLTPNQFYLLSDRYDLMYLTGIWTNVPEETEALLLISQTQCFVFTSLFTDASQLDRKTFSVQQGRMITLLANQLKSLHSAQPKLELQIDQAIPFFIFHTHLEPLLQKESLQFKVVTSSVAPLRMIKDETEQKDIARANQITHQVMNKTLDSLKEGVTEIEVARSIHQAFIAGADDELAFPIIVSFGEGSASPHHFPTIAKLKNNQPVLIDIGCRINHYCADVTRTIWFGDQPNPEFTKIKKIVDEAYQLTFDRLNAALSKNPPANQSLTAADLDVVARDYISKAGYGNQFIHTTGHGVGLFIHESPSLNQNNPTPLSPGMIITIEPGVYLPGKFGYRFENSVVIKKSSANELM